jgi:nucleoside-diphosphate-sugar epimerase
MKILFTGHRGFLGRELIPILRESHEVIEYPGDLSNWSEFESFVKTRSIDKIIHAAVRGGRRNKIDSSETLVNNLQTTFNVFKTGISTISFCSGAVYDRKKSLDSIIEEESSNSIPLDYYGQSKFIINRLAAWEEQVTTLRFFNVFGTTEGLDRFISFNVLQYIRKEPMVIFQDFYMDFFYVKDLLPVLNFWIAGGALPKELNLVYSRKLLLSEICEIINSISSYKVPVIHEGPRSEINYTGSGLRYENLFPGAIGLERGIHDMHQHFQKHF